jgi:ABC-type cobalamin/Fe3+-siderophores transport system ATPase subunit
VAGLPIAENDWVCSEAARAKADERRRGEVLPSASDLVDLIADEPGNGELLTGRSGITRAALARGLACSSNALGSVLPDAIGLFQIGRTKAVVKLYDPALLAQLANHPKVLASRQRMLTRVNDTNRREMLADVLHSCHSPELKYLRVEDFRTVQDTAISIHPLTVLFGKNGAGKSSILDAVHLSLTREATWDCDEKPLPAHFGLRVRCELSDEEIATAAAYLALGIRAPLRDAVEQLFAGLLTAPLFYGRQGDWAMGVDPGIAAELRPIAQRVAAEKLSSKIALELVSAFVAAVGEPHPVHALPLSMGSIAVSRLSSDTRDIERRVFDEVGTLARAAANDLREWSTQRFTQGPDRMANTRAGGERPSRQSLELLWLDGQMQATKPHLARHVSVQGRDGRALGPVSLASSQGVLDCFTTVFETSAGLDEADLPAVQTLVLMSRSGGQGRAESPWAHANPFERELAGMITIAVEHLANSLAPDFVVEHGRIMLVPPQHESSGTVAIGILDPRRGKIDGLTALPSGIGRWAALATDLALNEILNYVKASRTPSIASRLSEHHPDAVLRLLDRQELAAEESVALSAEVEAAVVGTNASHSPVVFLADEPELHLHPAAQEEIVRWCSAMATRWTTLVATHAAPFLRIPPSEGTIVRVMRPVGGATVAMPIEGPVIESLDELASSLGLGRDRLLQLTRGLVLVEGPVDAEVLRALCGDVVDRQRLAIVPLHGHSNASAVVDGELAAAIGLPLAVMFDDTTSEQLDELQRDPRAKVSDETRSVWKVLSRRSDGLDSHLIPLDVPDICGVLPEETVRARHSGFPGWDEISSRHRENPGSRFKDLFLDSIQVSRRKDRETIVGIAQAWDGRSPLPKPLLRARSSIEAWAEEISARDWPRHT